MACVRCVHKYNINMNTKKTYMADTIANTHELGLRVFIGLVYELNILSSCYNSPYALQIQVSNHFTVFSPTRYFSVPIFNSVT